MEQIKRSETDRERMGNTRILDIFMPILKAPRSNTNQPDPLFHKLGFKRCNDKGYTGTTPNNEDGDWAEQHSIESMYKVYEQKKQLIILHGPLRTTATDDKKPTDDKKNRNEYEDRLIKAQSDALDKIGNDSGMQIVHLIPQIQPGRVKKMTGGQFGADHIILRVIKGKLPTKSQDVSIDPRDVAQSTFNDVHCGHYVTAMIGAAVGLLDASLEVTADNLKKSPIVMEADKFTTVEAFQQLAESAAKYPTNADKQKNAINMIKQLQTTYALRKSDRSQTYRSVIFGGLFGHSADKKYQAAQAILQKFDFSANKCGLSDEEYQVANQGRLKHFIHELKKTEYKAVDFSESQPDKLTPG